MTQASKYRDIQGKAKQLVEEGMDLLRSGVKSAEVVAGKTLIATRLQYQSRRTQLDLYRALYDLGRAAYEQLKSSAGEVLQLTPDLLGRYGRIVELEKKIATAEKDLSHSTVVTRPTSGKARPATKINHEPRKPIP